MSLTKTKSEKRETIRRKRKSAPKGATLSGQLSRHKTTRNYRGIIKKMTRRRPRPRNTP